MCNSYVITLCIADRLKALDNNVTIIFGGPQASLCAESSLNHFSFIELIGIGEGELYITELIQCLVEGKNYTNIKGIAYREDGKVVISKCENMIASEALGEYAICNYGMLELDMSKVKYFPIEAGRGCPFGCTFCSTSMFWGRKFRIKPIDQLMYEMKKINENYAVTSFSLEHDMFTVNKQYLLEFCDRMIVENRGYKWACSSRIDALDEECMKKMKEAGCKSIFIGIETGSSRLQKVINKNLKLNDAVERILLLKDYGFELTVSFIYGFPDETENDFRATIDMIQTLLLNDIMNVQLHLFIPLPNTMETQKVRDRVYFDPLQIELSVYNANKFNKKMHQMLRDYRDVFIQFYTFDSYIRTQYAKMDFLLIAFVCAKATYKYSINSILQNESLLSIYDRHVDLIKKLDRKVNEVPVSESFDGLIRHKLLYSLVENIIESGISRMNCESLEEIYKFEHSIVHYMFENKHDTIILHSKYNIFKLFGAGELEDLETYASLTKTDTGVALKPIRVEEEIKQLF